MELQEELKALQSAIEYFGATPNPDLIPKHKVYDIMERATLLEDEPYLLLKFMDEYGSDLIVTLKPEKVYDVIGSYNIEYDIDATNKKGRYEVRVSDTQLFKTIKTLPEKIKEKKLKEEKEIEKVKEKYLAQLEEL